MPHSWTPTSVMTPPLVVAAFRPVGHYRLATDRAGGPCSPPGDRSQADKFRSIPPNGRYQAAVVAHFSDVNVAHGRSRPGTSPGGESR